MLHQLRWQLYQEILSDLGMSSELVSSLTQERAKKVAREKRGPKTLLEFDAREEEESDETENQQEESK